MLWALVRWQEKYTGFDEILAIVVPMASATSFTILTLTLLIRRKYESLWWLIALSDRFFEILSNEKRAIDLLTIIKEIIQERGPATDVRIQHEVGLTKHYPQIYRLGGNLDVFLAG